MRALQFQLRACWSVAEDAPSMRVLLSCECRLDLLWWCSDVNLLQGVPLDVPAPQFCLFPDASSTGSSIGVSLGCGRRWSVETTSTS